MTITPHKRIILKPWITPGLLRCIRNRDNMNRKLWKDAENYILMVTYKRYRNFLNNLLHKLKFEYQKNEFKKAKNDKKAMWHILKKVTNTIQQVEPPRALLNIKDNPKMAVNSVNEYFVKVAKDLAAKITPDHDEVERIIRGLRDNCAPG